MSIPELNGDQRAAVTYMGGPLRILAGAGTGKTQTLTARYVHLVEEEYIPANRILALTFSRKAAEEMRLRVLHQLSGGYPQLWIQTFHAFCLSLVGEWRREAGLRPPAIINDDVRRLNAFKIADRLPADCLSHYRGAASRRRLAADLLTLADRAKEHLLDVDAIDGYAARKERTSGRLHDLALAFRAYQRDLIENEATDFGDLAMMVVGRLQADPELQARTSARFAHVLVDEFQDTNKAQFELLRLLVPQDGQICVVGDPNQAIYAFRGGQSEYMEQFERYFPNAKSFNLTLNYRSGPEILDAANRLISHAHSDSTFKLLPHASNAAAKVAMTELATAEHEAEFVARRILEYLRDEEQPVQFGDVAILFRSLRASREPMIRALTANGIPYRLGGHASAQIEVARDLAAAFRLTIGPARWADAVALASREGYATEYRMLESRFSTAELDDVLLSGTPHNRELSDAEVDALGRARSIATRAALERDKPLPELVYQAMRLSGRLRDGAPLEIGRFLAGVLDQAVALAEKGAMAAEFLAQFVAGYEGEDDEAPDDPGGVQLMTVHAAKGLEWPVVFIAGLAEGAFPLPMRLDRDFDLDELASYSRDEGTYVGRTEAERAALFLKEERRLAYVAITRGKRIVHLTASRMRAGRSAPVSRFVREAGLMDLAGAAEDLDGLPATMPDLARRLRNRRQRALAAPIDGERAAAALADLMLAQWAANALVDGATPIRDRLIPAPNESGQALHFSYSQLGTYEACPRRYLYESVLRIESDEEDTSRAFGTAVHHALTVLNERWMTTGEPPADEVITATLDEIWPEGDFDCSAQRRQLRARAGAMLARFYARERERAPKRVPLAIESSFNAPYGAHQTRGRIDLVLRDTAGGVEIVDFKTSKWDSPTVAKPGESLQLFLYDRVWRDVNPGISPRVSFYALRHKDDKGFANAPDWSDKQELGLTHDDASSEPLGLRVDGLLAGILANQFDPIPTERGCGWCTCRWLCPEG